MHAHNKKMAAALESFRNNAKMRLDSWNLDSWVNNATGFGTDRDKSTHGFVMPARTLTDIELSALYHSDDMAARMIDVIPQEMLREGFDFSTGDPEIDTILNDKFDEIDAPDKFVDGIRWGRCYGGAAILIGADDGLDADMPLIAERAEDVSYLYVIDRRMLWPLSWYETPGHPKLGQPKTYLVTTIGGTHFSTSIVHESRLILFRGAPTGTREKMHLFGWDLSFLQRAYEVLRSFNSGWKAVETLLVDGNQAIFKMTGLADMLASGGEELLRTRMQTMDLYRSVMRAMVIDADGKEDFTRNAANFSNIPDVLDKICLRLAASMQMPVTILMGQSPAGMNATGDSDFRWFYDRIRAEQNSVLKPKIQRIAKIWLKTKAGKKYADALDGGRKIDVKFPNLWTDTPLQVAQRKAAIATADSTYIQAQVFSPEETALTRGQPDGFERDIELSEEAIQARQATLTAMTSPQQPGQQPMLGPDGQPMLDANGQPMMQPPQGAPGQGAPGQGAPADEGDGEEEGAEGAQEAPEDEEGLEVKDGQQNAPGGQPGAAQGAPKEAPKMKAHVGPDGKPMPTVHQGKPPMGPDGKPLPPPKAAPGMPPMGGDTTLPEVKLAPGDIGVLITANEARESIGLPPLPEGMGGNLLLPDFKVKYATSIAASANANKGALDDGSNQPHVNTEGAREKKKEPIPPGLAALAGKNGQIPPGAEQSGNPNPFAKGEDEGAPTGKKGKNPFPPKKGEKLDAAHFLARMDEWDESLHPRGPDGRFGEGDGSSSAKTESTSSGHSSSANIPKDKLAYGKSEVGKKVGDPFGKPPPSDDKDNYKPDPTSTKGSPDKVTAAARVGIPGKEAPPPYQVPRLANLTPKEREVEKRFADAFEKDPQKFIDAYRKQVYENKDESARRTFGTDDCKNLSVDYNANAENKALYNIAVHQTANMIAKAAFEQHMAEHVAKLPENERNVLVTAGGCAAGKGFALQNAPTEDVKGALGKAAAVWDTAGEQNSTELGWVQKHTEAAGGRAHYVFVDADPKVSFDRVVSRAQGDPANGKPGQGRVVDKLLFAESYAIGSKNFQAFAEKNKDNPRVAITYINVRQPPPKISDGISKDAASMTVKEVHEAAKEYIAKNAERLSPAVKAGATASEHIWGAQ